MVPDFVNRFVGGKDDVITEEALEKAGYDVTVVVVATEAKDVEILKTGEVKELDQIFAVK